MAVLSSTTNLLRGAPLPNGVTREKAIALLHNHDFMLRCDSNLSKYSAAPPNQKAEPVLPDKVRPVAETQWYAVHDFVQNVPGGIWKPDVESIGEYTSLESGLFMRVKSPLSITMETEWRVDAGANGDLELIYNSNITCSKLLVAMIKGSFEKNLTDIQELILLRLKDDGN